MFVHEMVHLKRRDYLWKWVAECICCIHWFNPLVWLALRMFTEDMEMFCDETVLRKRDYNERREYARIFLAETVESKEGSIVPFFCKGGTERRIRNMMKNKKLNKRTAGICAGVVVIAALLLIPGFWGRRSYGKETEKLMPGTEYGYPASEYHYQIENNDELSSDEVTENISKVADDICNTLGGRDSMIKYSKSESEELAINHGYQAYTMVFIADFKIPKGAKNKYGLSGKYKDMHWYLIKDDDGNWRIDDADIYHAAK